MKLKKHFEGIKPNNLGRPIEEVQNMNGLNYVVKLASNEHPYGCSPKVKQAIFKPVYF